MIMFNQRLKSLIKHGGILSLGYKIHKKIMFKYYFKDIKKLKSSEIQNYKTITRRKTLRFHKPFEHIDTHHISTHHIISIILVYEGDSKNLNRFLGKIFAKSTYPNYEIIIIALKFVDDSNLLQNIKEHNIKIIYYDESHSIFTTINSTVNTLVCDYIIFLENIYIEILCENWIEDLLHCLISNKASIVGVLFSYLDGKLQHFDLDLKAATYEKMKIITMTRSCLIIDINFLKQLKGFSEFYYRSYADLDLVLRAHEMGVFLQCTKDIIIMQKKIELENIDLMDRTLFFNRWTE